MSKASAALATALVALVVVQAFKKEEIVVALPPDLHIGMTFEEAARVLGAPTGQVESGDKRFLSGELPNVGLTASLWFDKSGRLTSVRVSQGSRDLALVLRKFVAESKGVVEVWKCPSESGPGLCFVAKRRTEVSVVHCNFRPLDFDYRELNPDKLTCWQSVPDLHVFEHPSTDGTETWYQRIERRQRLDHDYPWSGGWIEFMETVSWTNRQ